MSERQRVLDMDERAWSPAPSCGARSCAEALAPHRCTCGAPRSASASSSSTMLLGMLVLTAVGTYLYGSIAQGLVDRRQRDRRRRLHARREGRPELFRVRPTRPTRSRRQQFATTRISVLPRDAGNEPRYVVLTRLEDEHHPDHRRAARERQRRGPLHPRGAAAQVVAAQPGPTAPADRRRSRRATTPSRRSSSASAWRCRWPATTASTSSIRCSASGTSSASSGRPSCSAAPRSSCSSAPSPSS